MSRLEKATFAAGCFWGVQLDFDRIEGVRSTSVGYMGGHLDHPAYEDICSGTTNHAEVVAVEFDPAMVSYEELLGLFWQIHNPTTLNVQGPDRGSQYRSAIFYHSDAQREMAINSRADCDASALWPDPIVTEITSATEFWPAEDYHQKYLEKRHVKTSCQRGG